MARFDGGRVAGDQLGVHTQEQTWQKQKYLHEGFQYYGIPIYHQFQYGTMCSEKQVKSRKNVNIEDKLKKTHKNVQVNQMGAPLDGGVQAVLGSP